MSIFVCSGLWDKWARYYSQNSWLRISLMLCAFGFIKEFRPSEPFIYEFLIGEWRNITETQVTQEVYPVSTYSLLAFQLVVLLITDICRYKAIIVALGLCGCVIWSLLIWSTSLIALQILEVFYGAFMAAEVAYYTYIYAKVESDYYQEVSSHTRAAILAGRSLSGVLGQVFVSCHVMDYKQLNYITLGAMILATLWALCLPSVKRTIYFHQNTNDQMLTSTKYLKAFTLMKSHLVDSFTKRYTLKWSLWWSLTTAGFIQVQYYVQPLYSEIQKDETDPIMYNGAIEAVATILGFFGALLGGYLKVDWRQKGELILSICAITGASIILIASQTVDVRICYACYAVYCGIYHLIITIASSEIAKSIVEDSYGLVFGMNMFLALVLQTGLTLAFVSKDVGFALTSRNQFLAYGIYHICIAGIFIIIGLIGWIKSNKDIKKTYS